MFIKLKQKCWKLGALGVKMQSLEMSVNMKRHMKDKQSHAWVCVDWIPHTHSKDQWGGNESASCWKCRLYSKWVHVASCCALNQTLQSWFQCFNAPKSIENVLMQTTFEGAHMFIYIYQLSAANFKKNYLNTSKQLTIQFAHFLLIN